jgi:CBS domain-containing protein
MKSRRRRSAGPNNPTAVRPDLPVARLVCRSPVGIDGTASLAKAARRMRREGVSSLLVDGGAAIVTERDICRSIGAGAEPDEPVAMVASPHPLVVNGSVSFVECGGIMLEEQVRHVLVAMPESWTGVVSQRDVVGALLRGADPELWSARRDAEDPMPSQNWLG